jgi:predicted ester cyclase
VTITTDVTGSAESEAVARSYFESIDHHDLEAQVAHWAPDGIGRFPGRLELPGPSGVRSYFGALFGAFPDFRLETIDVFAQGDRVAVRWRARGTFTGPGKFEGLLPNGASVDIEGADVLYTKDGLIRVNNAYFDATVLARQLGALPPEGSLVERGMTAALNLRTRLAAALSRSRRAEGSNG